MTPWPKVALREVMELRQDEHPVTADSRYPNIGIYSFGRGLFEKPPIEGATSSARILFRVRARQFIYSRLFAFEGAYGLVPDQFDGSFVSNELPSFELDQHQLCPKFLELQFKLPSTWKILAERTVGMGDRRQKIKPDQLLTYEIPLPPLAEQRRIVVKIERLAAKIDEARGVRHRASNEIETLLERGIEAAADPAAYEWHPLANLCRETVAKWALTAPERRTAGSADLAHECRHVTTRCDSQ